MLKNDDVDLQLKNKIDFTEYLKEKRKIKRRLIRQINPLQLKIKNQIRNSHH